MGLVRNQNANVRISPTDKVGDYLIGKVVAGENISLDLICGADQCEQLVVSAGNVSRKSTVVTEDTILDCSFPIVLVDASKNPVRLTLPSPFGQISIICVDASHGIELTGDIYDASNIDFHVKGDSLTLISDQTTWYVVGRYSAQWYA